MTESPKIGNVKLSMVANCERDGGTPLTAAVKQLENFEDVRDYISHIDFSLLKEKLSLSPDQGGEGWDSELIEKAEAKYKKWLILKWKHEGELIPPPMDIDVFWHGHILESHSYFRDTLAIFGKYLHHYPYFGIRGKADKQKLDTAFENTKRLYREEFGEDVTA